MPTVQFAEVLSTYGVPHYLKVDIEGADDLCLRALLDFHRRPRYISLESEQRNWKALEEEFRMLTLLGYNRFVIVQQGTIPGRSITTRGLDGVPLRYTFEADASGPFGEDVGPWVDRRAALRRYRRLFLSYRLLGHSSPIRRARIGRGLRGQAARLSGHPLPGWHDLHATRVDVSLGGPGPAGKMDMGSRE